MKKRKQFINDAEDIRNAIDQTNEEIKFAYEVDLDQLNTKDIADFIYEMLSIVELSTALINDKIDHLETEYGKDHPVLIMNETEDIRKMIDEINEELKLTYTIDLDQLNTKDIADFIYEILSIVELSTVLIDEKIDHLVEEYGHDNSTFDTPSDLYDYIVEALGDFVSSFFNC